MNWPTSGPSANYSKLLVSDTTNVFDQNTCFLQDVLVSKQKISALLNFDQVVYIYHAGQVSFKNLKALEQRCCLNFSETGSQLIFSKSFTPMWLLLSSWRQYLIHLFWIVCNLLFSFLFRFGYQAEQAWSKCGWIKALHKICLRYGVKYLLNILCRNLSLLLILFITFKAIASPDKVSSNSQPEYVTFEYCLILTSPYSMSRGTIFLFQFLVEKRIDLVLSFPKWMLNLLSTNQSHIFEKFFVSSSFICSRSLCWNNKHVSSA